MAKVIYNSGFGGWMLKRNYFLAVHRITPNGGYNPLVPLTEAPHLNFRVTNRTYILALA